MIFEPLEQDSFLLVEHLATSSFILKNRDFIKIYEE